MMLNKDRILAVIVAQYKGYTAHLDWLVPRLLNSALLLHAYASVKLLYQRFIKTDFVFCERYLN